MKKYIKKFNERSSVIPKREPEYRKLSKGINFDYMLCRKTSKT